MHPMLERYRARETERARERERETQSQRERECFEADQDKKAVRYNVRWICVKQADGGRRHRHLSSTQFI